MQTANSIDLGDIGASYISHTSDMGVELSLPDFHMDNAHTLLPRWMSREGLRVDPDDPQSDIDGDFDGPLVVGAGDPDADPDLDGPAVGPAAAAHEPSAMKTPHLMPQSLTVAGMQHITNNLCNDVHTHLSYWGTFYSL